MTISKLEMGRKGKGKESFQSLPGTKQYGLNPKTTERLRYQTRKQTNPGGKYGKYVFDALKRDVSWNHAQ